MSDGPNVLTLDIETLPNEVYTWGLWDQNVAINQIVAPGRVFGVGYKWLDQKAPSFFSSHSEGSQQQMAEIAHHLLDRADIVVTFNGGSFDLPHLNTEFVKGGLTPPSPYKHIDLFRVAKRQFRFPSNKLDYIAQALDIGQKMKHEGFDLWRGCMAGDVKAIGRMGRYCKQDVRITEALYLRIIGWQANPPHAGLWAGEDRVVCAACGGANLQLRGEQVKMLQIYNRYQCQDCGKWDAGKNIIRRVARGE